MVGFGLILSGLQFYMDFGAAAVPAFHSSLGVGPSNEQHRDRYRYLALSFWFFQTYVEKVYDVKS